LIQLVALPVAKHINNLEKNLARQSQNHRSVEVGWDLWKSLSPSPAQSRVNHSRLLRAMSGWVMNISKDGDSAASLGDLLQCLASLPVKTFYV